MGWRAHSDAAGFVVSSFSRVDGHRVDCSSGLINMSVSLNLLPVVGVPLPFISIGGSALVSALLAVGLLLACARTEPDARRSTAASQRTERPE